MPLGVRWKDLKGTEQSKIDLQGIESKSSQNSSSYSRGSQWEEVPRIIQLGRNTLTFFFLSQFCVEIAYTNGPDSSRKKIYCKNCKSVHPCILKPEMKLLHPLLRQLSLIRWLCITINTWNVLVILSSQLHIQCPWAFAHSLWTQFFK